MKFFVVQLEFLSILFLTTDFIKINITQSNIKVVKVSFMGGDIYKGEL